MEVILAKTKEESGRKAAAKGAQLIRCVLAEKGDANIVVATGASQFEMLSCLVKEKLDWQRVCGFHLDEYIGISSAHPASFCKYLKERFVDLLPLKEFHFVDGENESRAECKRLAQLIGRRRIDVTFIGIGENGHLAFNDPPADFDTEEPYIIVELDEACRRQQMAEGWFKQFQDVPQTAISMSIRQILLAKNIICTVPEKRKAVAVQKTMLSEISAEVPASILRRHAAVYLFLDRDSASLLPPGSVH